MKRGRFASVAQYQPAERVYEGTDAFQNHCISEDRKFHSSGGRLYCVRPAVVDACITGVAGS